MNPSSCNSGQKKYVTLRYLIRKDKLSLWEKHIEKREKGREKEKGREREKEEKEINKV